MTETDPAVVSRALGLLREADEMLTPDTWTTQSFARDGDQSHCDSTSPRAEHWCLVGALNAATHRAKVRHYGVPADSRIITEQDARYAPARRAALEALTATLADVAGIDPADYATPAACLTGFNDFGCDDVSGIKRLIALTLQRLAL